MHYLSMTFFSDRLLDIMTSNGGRLTPDVTRVAQFIAVCSSSILAETLGYAVSFSSPWRGKRRVFERCKPVFIDQLQPSTNSDKLSGSTKARLCTNCGGFCSLSAMVPCRKNMRKTRTTKRPV